MVAFTPLRRIGGAVFSLSLGACVASTALSAQTLPEAYTKVVELELGQEAIVADFYRENGYIPLWTGAADSARRAALLSMLSRAPDHALPLARYDVAALQDQLRNAHSEGDRARVEVALTRAYLAFARDISSGATTPAQVDPTIVRDIVRPDPLALLLAAKAGDVGQVLQVLMPRNPVYAQLMRAKLDLEAQITQGGWGPSLRSSALAVGAKGALVVALRDRLIAMGYLDRTASSAFDKPLEAAVKQFQTDHGIPVTGKLGEQTIKALNVTPEERLKAVVVAMERQRWMGDGSLGERYIWVNLPSFSTQIIDQGRVTFETRSVIGKNDPSRMTPEFSDQMVHMVINPSWGVPRSIVTQEYLPLLQRNPNAVSHIDVIDNRGRVVPRNAVNFASYTARSFPFAMRQAPSDSNSLGKVKFMFPNKHNIYLHDTPSKNLFSQTVRAYSHGCIRLNDPQDFAYALLAAQTDKGEALFQKHLKTGKETTVNLEKKVPVHLVYFTAYPGADGKMTYLNDVYGRDAKLYDALESAGMVLPALRG